MLYRHTRFLVLLLVFISAVLLCQAALPILEGNDETLHYNYVVWLRTQNRLPDRAAHASNPTRQESGQPPLTYWVAATVLNWLKVPHTTTSDLLGDTQMRNLWFTPPDWSHRTDNFNLYFHGDGEQAFGHPDIVEGDRIARLLSMGYGVVAVIGAYGASREIFRGQMWALTATAIFAFTPQMVYMSSALNNDVSGMAFSTLVIWQALCIVRRGASPRRLIGIGLLIGLAGLSKINSLLVTPAVGVALLIDWYNHRNRRAFARLITNGLIVGIVAALILGPWMVYGAVTYQDPFGFLTHHDPGDPNVVMPSLAQVLSTLPEVYQSYWAKFGTSSIWMNQVVYLLCTGIVLLSLAGYGLFFISRYRLDWGVPPNPALPPVKRGRENSASMSPSLFAGEGLGVGDEANLTIRQSSQIALQHALILGCVVLVTVAGLVVWLRILFVIAYAITGRLIYPAHLAVALGLTGGLYLLGCARRDAVRAALRLFTVGTLAATSLILAPVTIRAAYAPPAILTRAALPELHGPTIDYDHTIRFLGYTRNSPAIQAGTLYHITLCWEVLQPAQRPAAFSLKLFRDSQGVGERTSVFGLGHYDSSQWKPGDIFCDAVDAPVTGAVDAGQRVNLLLVVLDPRTMAVDWQPTAPDGTPVQFPFIAQADAE